MAFEVTRSRWYVQPLDAAVESHTDSQWFYSIIFNNSSLGSIKKLRETQEIGTLKEKKQKQMVEKNEKQHGHAHGLRGGKNNAAGGKEIIRGIMRKPVGRAGKR